MARQKALNRGRYPILLTSKLQRTLIRAKAGRLSRTGLTLSSASPSTIEGLLAQVLRTLNLESYQSSDDGVSGSPLLMEQMTRLEEQTKIRDGNGAHLQ